MTSRVESNSALTQNTVSSLGRFVKERRPSISPNFNFLGQLQHFQGTLSQKATNGSLTIQPLPSPDASLRSTSESISHTSPGKLAANQSMDYQATTDSREADSPHRENLYNTNTAEHRHSHSGDSGNPRPLTLSLSGKLRTLNLTVNHNNQEVQTPCEAPAFSHCEPVKPAPKPTKLQLPVGSPSLLEKRKSLTLSLSPLGGCPLAHEQNTLRANSSQPSGSTSKTVRKSEIGARHEAKRQSVRSPAGGATSSQPAGPQREWSSRATQSRLEGEQQGLLSPLSLTLNKLLGWGERMLLGTLLATPVRMGQAALPYR